VTAALVFSLFAWPAWGIGAVYLMMRSTLKERRELVKEMENHG
jgi:hypothetical protein